MSQQDLDHDHMLCHKDKLEHAKFLLQYVNQCRNEGLFNDVIVKTRNQNFHGNRMILSCFSPFFKTMFRSEMKERYQEAVEIKDFDPDAVQLLLTYIYTGNIKIENENVMEVLAAADFMQLDKVKDICFEFLESKLSTTNCVDVTNAFTMYKPTASSTHIYQFISEHLDEVSNTDAFKELPENKMLSLFQSINQHKLKETLKYQAFRNWIKHEKEGRAPVFSSLFQSIDLYRLPPEFLEDVVATDSLVMEHIDCLKAVVTVISQNCKEARKESGDNIICIGGNNNGSVDELYSCTFVGNSVKDLPLLPHKIFYHCSIKHQNELFCIGGAINYKVENATDKVIQLKLNDPFKKWEEKASMNDKRCYFGATLFQGNLLVAGGSDATKHLFSVEAFEVNSNNWRYLSKLNYARSGNALVSCGACVYAIGGWGDDCLSSVERLTNLNQKWVVVESMNTPRNCLAAVEHNGFIYAIGGFSSKVEKSVEKYDPTNNSWTSVSDMNVERHRHAACVFRGKICVVGGTNSEKEIVMKMECYDPVRDTWSIVSDTPRQYDGHSLVAV